MVLVKKKNVFVELFNRMEFLGGPSNENKDSFNLPLPYHLKLVIWLLYGLRCVRAFGNEVYRL